MQGLLHESGHHMSLISALSRPRHVEQADDHRGHPILPGIAGDQVLAQPFTRRGTPAPFLGRAQETVVVLPERLPVAAAVHLASRSEQETAPLFQSGSQDPLRARDVDVDGTHRVDPHHPGAYERSQVEDRVPAGHRGAQRPIVEHRPVNKPHPGVPQCGDQVGA